MISLNPLNWFKKDASFEDVLARISLLGKTASGEAITEETALQSPTFYAAVTAIARTISQLPIEVIRKSADGTKIVDKNHPLYKTLALRPNEWQSRYEYWNNVATMLLMHNVFYAYKNQAPDGRLLNLHPLHPSNVTARQLSDMRIIYDVRFANGEMREISQEKMHRVMMMSLDGITPVSPIKKLREAIGLEIAAEKYGASLFENGAIPNIVIKRPGHFQDETAFNRFRDSWNAMFKRKGGTAILEDGFEIEKLQLTAEESQFLETRKLQRSVLAGALNITPHRIGELSRATFNNVEQLSLEYINYTVLPYLIAIETAISRDLVPEAQRDSVKVKFNVDGLLRGDSKTRAETLAVKRQWGVISANEWRVFDDMNPIDDESGDQYIVPLNYTLADSSEKVENQPQMPIAEIGETDDEADEDEA